MLTTYYCEDYMNILITNLSYHASMDIIKLLKSIDKINFFIIGTSTLPYGNTSASKFVDKFIFQPPFAPELKYLEFIIKLCNQEQIDILFAIDEYEIKILSKYKDLIPAKFICPESDIIELFCDKEKANQAMKKLSINIPKSIESNADLNDINSNTIISRKKVSCASLGIKRFNINEIENVQDLITESTILQENILGMEYCVDVFCNKNGIPLIIVPRDRIAIRGGTTHKCSLIRNEKLISICKKICYNYKLPGFSNIQFIVEDKTNKIYFLEVNPRIGATTIASSLGSFNWIELFINHFYYDKPLENFEDNMNKVKWGAFISRYYEETICLKEENDR